MNDRFLSMNIPTISIQIKSGLVDCVVSAVSTETAMVFVVAVMDQSVTLNPLETLIGSGVDDEM